MTKEKIYKGREKKRKTKTKREGKISCDNRFCRILNANVCQISSPFNFNILKIENSTPPHL